MMRNLILPCAGFGRCPVTAVSVDVAKLSSLLEPCGAALVDAERVADDSHGLAWPSDALFVPTLVVKHDAHSNAAIEHCNAACLVRAMETLRTLLESGHAGECIPNASVTWSHPGVTPRARRAARRLMQTTSHWRVLSLTFTNGARATELLGTDDVVEGDWAPQMAPTCDTLRFEQRGDGSGSPDEERRVRAELGALVNRTRLCAEISVGPLFEGAPEGTTIAFVHSAKVRRKRDGVADLARSARYLIPEFQQHGKAVASYSRPHPELHTLDLRRVGPMALGSAYALAAKLESDSGNLPALARVFVDLLPGSGFSDRRRVPEPVQDWRERVHVTLLSRNPDVRALPAPPEDHILGTSDVAVYEDYPPNSLPLLKVRWVTELRVGRLRLLATEHCEATWFEPGPALVLRALGLCRPDTTTLCKSELSISLGTGNGLDAAFAEAAGRVSSLTVGNGNNSFAKPWDVVPLLRACLRNPRMHSLVVHYPVASVSDTAKELLGQLMGRMHVCYVMLVDPAATVATPALYCAPPNSGALAGVYVWTNRLVMNAAARTVANYWRHQTGSGMKARDPRDALLADAVGAVAGANRVLLATNVYRQDPVFLRLVATCMGYVLPSEACNAVSAFLNQHRDRLASEISGAAAADDDVGKIATMMSGCYLSDRMKKRLLNEATNE